MKKLIIIVVFLLIGSSLIAQGLSAGAGLTVSPMRATVEGDLFLGRTPIGARVFVDAGFVEAAVGMEFYNSLASDLDDLLGGADFTASAITIGVLGKLPIPLGSIVLSPMAGLTYMRALTFSGDGFEIGDFEDDDRKTLGLDRLWINGGVAVDFPLSPSMYLRGSGLFGYGLNNDIEKEIKDLTDTSIVNTRWDFGVSVGFRF